MHLGEICFWRRCTVSSRSYTLGTSPIVVAEPNARRVCLIFTKNQTNNCFIGLEGFTASTGGMIGLSTTTLTQILKITDIGLAVQDRWYATANSGAPTLCVVEVISTEPLSSNGGFVDTSKNNQV